MQNVVLRPSFWSDGDDGFTRPRLVDATSRAAMFDELHDRYFDDVRRYVQRRVGDAGLAEDIAQETFLRAFGSATVLDAERPVWPWLQTIAHNLAVNRIRDEGRLRRFVSGTAWTDLESEEDQRPENDPEKRFSEQQRHEAITSSLAALPTRQRRMLLLRVVENLSYEEIARGEGITVDASRSLVKRARKTFRERYAALAADHGLGAGVSALQSQG